MASQPACQLPKLSVDSEAMSMNLKIISDRLKRKWMLLTVVVIVIAFLSWLIFNTLREVWMIYKRYKDNVNEKKQVLVDTNINPVFDDEVYNNPPKDPNQFQEEDVGAAIRKKLDSIKSEYKEFNKTLRESKPGSQDIVDEKIMSSQYDDY